MRSTNSVRKLAWGVSSLGFGQTTLLVYLPWLVELTPAGYGQWAHFFAAGMACYLIGSLVWPLLLPRYGHRALLYLGLVGFGFSMALLAIFSQLWQLGLVTESSCLSGLLISRLCYGLCASALMPVTQSWASEMSSASERLAAFSAISLQFTVGRFLGPIIAIASLWVHPLAPVVLLSCWPLFVIVLMRSVPNVSARQLPFTTKMNMISTYLKPPAALSVVAIGTTALASTLQFQASPVLAYILNATPSSISQTLALLLTLAALASAIAHLIQLRHPPNSVQKRIILVCLLILFSSIGMGLVVWSQTLWLLFLAVTVSAMGIAWLTPLYSSQLSLQNDHQSIAATQLSVLHILGHWIGLSITGVLMEFDLLLLSLWMTIIGILMLVAASMAKMAGTHQAAPITSQN